jgi:hypothetical protein
MEMFRHTLIFCALISAFAWPSTAAPGDDSDILTPLSDDATDSKPSSEGFNVTTKKIKGLKIDQTPRAIVIVKPAPKAKFTRGVIEFAWKVNADLSSRKSIIALENLDTGEITNHPTGDKSLSLELAPGKYRWQVMIAGSSAQTFWRYIEVIGSTQVADGSLKSIPSFDIQNPTSNYEPKISHDELRKEQDSSPLNKKNSSQQQAKDLEKQVRAAQLEAKKAMKLAQDEQAHLAQLKLEKIQAEKLEKQKLAKAEADRRAQIVADRVAKQKEKKLLAQRESEKRLARTKVEKAQKKFRLLVEQVKKARAALELAIKDSSLKASVYKQAYLKLKNPGPERVPASDTSDQEAAPK